MNLKSQKHTAAKIMKIGVSRVVVSQDKAVEEAITRNDIRKLIVRGIITKKPVKGVSRIHANKILHQKNLGRRSGIGSRKGGSQALKTRKDIWIDHIRALRKLLMELRDSGRLERKDYRKMYLMAKGGAFRNKNHMLFYMKDKDMMKAKEKKEAKKK